LSSGVAQLTELPLSTDSARSRVPRRRVGLWGIGCRHHQR